MTATAPPRPAAPAGGPPPLTPFQRATRFGPIAYLRRGWRRLTSMRTALILLFLLALAAVPGSLLPQRALNPTRTAEYIASHGSWGEFLDRIGGFAVFSSPWFAAVYLLLFVSLIGCILPRVKVHVRALRAKPLPAPRNLGRLPESARLVTASPDDERSPQQLADDLRGALGRRWRTTVREEANGAVAVSAEKGYLRETGNIVFHVALVLVLVFVAIGHLFGYTGTVLVTEGRGFCNTVLAYDSFKAGQLAQAGRVAPFCVDSLDSFTAKYRDDGSAESYEAKITYSRGAHGAPEQYDLKVNEPLRIEGDRLYLLSHGYSAQMTVTRPNGDVRTMTSALVPQDPNYNSEGAFKLQYGVANDQNKHTDDIGLEVFLAPTAVNAGGVVTSVSPQLTNPMIAMFAYTGDLGLSSGAPQSVYSLDQQAIADGSLTRVGEQNMAPGDVMTLPDGTTVRFDAVLQWASMQVSHDPVQGYLLIAVVVLTAGLILSLFVRRRRVWIRVGAPSPAASSRDAASGASVVGGAREPRTVVQVGGLARSDAGSFPDEFEALIRRLSERTGLVSPADDGARAGEGPDRQPATPPRAADAKE